MPALRRSAGWAWRRAPISVTALAALKPRTAPKYADKDVINPSSVILSGAMMFDFLGWGEAARLIEDGIARTIQQKRVTYDLERLMEGATKLRTSEFASAIIENMGAVVAAA